jgi:hypothetical protein
MLKSSKGIYYIRYNIMTAKGKNANYATVFMNQLLSNSLVCYT